jgi:hypothetical protein
MSRPSLGGQLTADIRTRANPLGEAGRLMESEGARALEVAIETVGKARLDAGALVEGQHWTIVRWLWQQKVMPSCTPLSGVFYLFLPFCQLISLAFDLTLHLPTLIPNDNSTKQSQQRQASFYSQPHWS